MFIVTDNPTFTHTVEAHVPTDGGFEIQKFKVTYNLVAGEEFEAFDLSTREGSSDLLRKVIASIGDLVDAERNPVPYSDAIREKVIRLPWARRAIVKGYFDAVNKEAEGN